MPEHMQSWIRRAISSMLYPCVAVSQQSHWYEHMYLEWSVLREDSVLLCVHPFHKVGSKQLNDLFLDHNIPYVKLLIIRNVKQPVGLHHV